MGALNPMVTGMNTAAAATKANADEVAETASELAAQAAVAADAAGLRGNISGSLSLGAGSKAVTLTAAYAGENPARPLLMEANRQVALVNKADSSIKMFGNIASSPAPTPTTATITVVSDGVFPPDGSGSYSGWHLIDAAFFQAGATAEDEWAGETDEAASTPKSRADADAPVTIAYASTITPNMLQGRYRRLTASASFTLGAPINAKPGQILIIDGVNSAGGVVLAVNSALQRSSLGVIGPGNGARWKIVVIIDEVDGDGVTTRATYNVQRVSG